MVAQSQTATDALNLVAFGLDIESLSTEPLTVVACPLAENFDMALLVNGQIFVSLCVGVAAPKTAHGPIRRGWCILQGRWFLFVIVIT